MCFRLVLNMGPIYKNLHLGVRNNAGAFSFIGQRTTKLQRFTYMYCIKLFVSVMHMWDYGP